MGNSQEHHYFYRMEKPVHEVYLSDFYIGSHEVTNAEYILFLNEIAGRVKLDTLDRVASSSIGIRVEEDIFIDVMLTPDSTLQSGIMLMENITIPAFQVIPGFENYPVTHVTWYGARAYCQWKYGAGGLPSESQWEYAARSGVFWDQYDFKYAGSNDIDSVAWYWENAKFKAQPVKKKQPNQLGIYDMSGNLWEWIEDHWHDDYVDAPSDGSPWIRANVSKDFNRVLRGGAWLYSEGEATTTNRWSDVPDDRHDYKGFRCQCPAQ